MLQSTKGSIQLSFVSELYSRWKKAYNPDSKEEIVIKLSPRNFVAKPSSDDFLSEMVILCTVFINRGADLIKIIAKTRSKAGALLSRYQTKYKFTTSAAQKGKLGKKDVTLGKLAGTFPILCCSIIEHAKPQLLGPIKLGEVLCPINFMRHPIFIATTPSTLPQATRKAFKIYYIVLQNYVDNIITKKKKASERRDREINIVTFMNATLDSKFIPDEVKTNFWVQKKIIKRTGEAEDNIQLFLNAANRIGQMLSKMTQIWMGCCKVMLLKIFVICS